MKCSQCKQQCEELFECDCAEYSELCEKCWHKVPTRHREEVCFCDWIDYNDCKMTWEKALEEI